jgi:hypothetical protein
VTVGRRLATAAGVALLALTVPLLSGVAGAVETTQFGLLPGPGGPPSRHMVVQVRPGHATADSVLVFNKTAKPLALTLAVLPASVDAGGAPEVGGDATAVGWVDLSQTHVTVPAGGSVPVRFTVHAPRQLPKDKLTMAIAAEPTAVPGQTVAVLNRLALLVTIEGKPGAALSAPLGAIAWVAAALVVAVLAAAGWRAAHR